MSRTQLKKLDLFDDFEGLENDTPQKLYDLEIVNGLSGLDEPTQAKGTGISPFVKKAAIFGGGVYVFYKVLAMYQLSNEVATVVDSVKFKLDKKDGGLLISCSCSVDNPTNQSVSIGRPVVTLKVGGLSFATIPSPQTYRIRELSRSSIGTYDFL